MCCPISSLPFRAVLKRQCKAAAAGLVGLALAQSAFAEPALTVVAEFATGSPARIAAMRLDPVSGRLLLVQGKVLTILAGADGQVQANLRFTSQPTGLAIASGPGKALVALGHDNTLSIIDLESAGIEASTESPVEFPSIAEFDSASETFLVASQRNPGLASIDPGGNTRETAGTPGAMVSLLATGRGWLFGAATGEASIHVFDSLTVSELGKVPVPGCRYPSDMALDDVERRLYLGCTNGTFLALDSDTGVVLNRRKLGEGKSRLALRVLKDRIIQAVVAAEGGKLSILEGRITASRVRGVHDGPVNAGAIEIEPETGRILLATGSTVSLLTLQ